MYDVYWVKDRRDLLFGGSGRLRVVDKVKVGEEGLDMA